MNRIRLLIPLLALVLLTAACGDKTKKSYDEIGASGLTTRTENLQANLRTFASKGVIVGQQYGTLEGVGWKADTVGQSDFQSICNDRPACSGYELAGLEQGRQRNADALPFSAIRTDVLHLFRKGGLVLMTWTAPDYRGNEQLLDRWLGRLASFLASLHDEYGIKAPVVLCPYPLKHGAWYVRLSPAAYKKLFAHTVEKLRDEGVTNAIFGLSYTDDMPLSQVEGFLPEGIDVLNASALSPAQAAGSTPAYRERLEQCVQRLVGLAQDRNLAAGLTAGVEGLPTSDVFTQGILPVIRAHRLSYLLLGANRGDIDEGHYHVPFPGLDNERISDFVQFYNDETTVFLGTLNGLYLSK